jgi:hypothetical protein
MLKSMQFKILGSVIIIFCNFAKSKKVSMNKACVVNGAGT